ncbi:UDP-glycosyltransferase UGT5-like [Megachile rotundata]|uniref:UDP-glycosyltransferase UGT5-like n=1 Tax=Megachile rotundata TaxID=143995 RepID=UPI003FD1F34C
MKLNAASLLFALCALCAIEKTRSAKILALDPFPSFSHQVPFRKLILGLQKRGHEVVYATTHPIPNVNLKNFTQIDLSRTPAKFNTLNFMQFRFDGVTWIEVLEKQVFSACESSMENLFNNPKMKRLYAADSDAKFDVVLAEFSYIPSIYSMAHRFDAPLIGLSSLGLLNMYEYALGGFVLPSNEYSAEMGARPGSNLPFWQRVRNYIVMWRTLYKIFNEWVPRHQKMAEHYLGTKLPPLIDIVKNTSLVFVNEPEPFTPARPKLPNMISFTSLHVDENPPPAPKDLQRFMDEAKQGFIYMSLGGNARSADIPMDVQQIFFDVFSKLPYRVVWKYEEDFPVKLDNVYASKWLPQQSILAHSNIKLFMYQGGLQSTEEAISNTVPVMGFPVLSDQDYITSRVNALGIGKWLTITTLTREQLDNTIREVITNKEYKQRITHLKDLIRDTAYNEVDRLVWWTEYVIRHKGAPHLRSTLVNQPWYQRYDIDVVMFLAIVAFVIVSTLVYIIARIIVRVHRQLLSPTTQKKKIN